MEIEEESKSIQDYLLVLNRYKKSMLWTAVSIFAIALLLALKWPATYKSTATILIEQQEIPPELVRSTITSFADQRIQVISQRVMTSENIKAIIDKYNLYADDRKTDTLETLYEKFRKDVQLEMVSADVVDPQSGRPTQATIAFTLAFNSQSAQLAQQVANELVSLYLNENLKRRSMAASETTSFLAMEADKLASHIAELEKQMATFKEQNANALPELQSLNMQVMDRTEQQIAQNEQQITALNERKLYLEAELAQLQPNLSTFTGTGERIYGPSDRLKALQAEYIALSARYAPNHPDVIKMEREISALEQEVGDVDKIEIIHKITQKKGELAELSERYAPEHPDVIKLQKTLASLQRALDKPERSHSKAAGEIKPDNPAYIQLQSQLQSAVAEISALRGAKASMVAKLNGLERNLRTAPQVERQYHELMRDYENSTLKYREVKAKQMEADMSQAMEKDSKGEHFSLIEPPLFPEKPVKPNRLAIGLLGFILALGSGLGQALVRSGLDPGIYGSKELQSIIGAPPIMVLPYFENKEDFEQKSLLKKRIWFSGVGSLLAAILLIHFLITPLDVLWFILLRKLGFSGDAAI